MIKRIHWILFLIMLMLGRPLSWASVPEPGDISIVQNRLESMEKRKSAIERLKNKDIQNPRTIESLIKIVKNPNEPVSLRAYAIEMLLQMDEALVRPNLQKIIGDSSLTPEIRKSALHALWKQNPAEIKSELIRWAQSSYEQPEMRVAAIGYLGHTDAQGLPLEFWNGLLSRQNPVSVRIACLNSMEQLGLRAGDTSVLLGLIHDVKEKEEFRKSAVITAARMLSPAALEEEFLSILANPKDSFAMKMFAIDNLSAQPNPALATRIKSLIQKEQLIDIRRELERLTIKLKKPTAA